MIELLKLKVSKDTALSQLFAKGHYSLKDENEFLLDKASSIDFNTYFNSIYPAFFFHRLTIKNLQIVFHFSGNIKCRLLHRGIGFSETTVFEKTFI